MEPSLAQPTNNIASFNGIIQDPSFNFYFKDGKDPIIRIDETGFSYKGERIEDAGEVYRLFKEFLEQRKRQ